MKKGVLKNLAKFTGKHSERLCVNVLTEHHWWADPGFSTPTIEDFVATLICSLKFDMNSAFNPLELETSH